MRTALLLSQILLWHVPLLPVARGLVCVSRQPCLAPQLPTRYVWPRPGLKPPSLLCSVALGYDEGTALVKIGREEPVASMESSGKIIWARHNEIQTVNVKSLGTDSGEVGY